MPLLRATLLALVITVMSQYCQATTPRQHALRAAFERITNPLVTDDDWKKITVDNYDPPKHYVESLDITMIGKWLKSMGGRNISAFQGIKFGTIQSRFKHSTLVDQYWDNGATEIYTNHLADKCVQRSYIGNFSSGNNDECLALNVYVPGKASETNTLPVMVFIHGGSFTSGDASMYQPTRLLDEDVILVTIQYRLGSLGWFSVMTNDAPGNAGLSDQINAIKWVNNHISSFGGDTNRITIFGQSAGSASVSMLQTIGDITDGMFSGVIAESGSALEYWAIDSNPLQSASILANICGCNDASSQSDIYDCLMKKTDYEISDCTHDMVSDQREKGYMGFEGVSPVVQTENIASTNRLIKKMPLEYITNGEAVDVPVMMGANRDEGSFVFGVMYLDYLVPRELVDDSEYLANDMISDVLQSFGVQDQTKCLSKALQAEYLPGVDMTSFDAVSDGMIDLTGVLFLKAGTYQTCLYHSQYYNTSSFFYSFDFMSEENSLFKWLFAFSEELPFEGGVTHADELMYLFSLPADMGDAEMKTKDRLVKLWTNFAKVRNPTPSGDSSLADLGLPVWNELDLDNLNYLLIEDDVKVMQDYTERWHVRVDANTNVGGTTTTESGGDGVDIDKLQQERDDFLIVMIVFIIAFVVASCAAAYFYFKARR